MGTVEEMLAQAAEHNAAPQPPQEPPQEPPQVDILDQVEKYLDVAKALIHAIRGL